MSGLVLSAILVLVILQEIALYRALRELGWRSAVPVILMGIAGLVLVAVLVKIEVFS